MPRARSRSSASASPASSPALRTRSAASASPLAARCSARPQRQRERHQPLLRAVVQVALEPAALGVGRGDHAGAGVAQVGHLRGQLGVLVGAEQLRSRRSALSRPSAAQRRDADEQRAAPRRHEQQHAREVADHRCVAGPVVDPDLDHRREDAARSPPAMTAIASANVTIPIGRRRIRKTRSFQVAGSTTYVRRRVEKRRVRRAPAGTAAGSRTPSRRSMSQRSTLGEPAPGEQHPDQDRDADQRDQRAEAERDADRQEEELAQPDRERDQQVEDARVGARVPQLAEEDRPSGRQRTRGGVRRLANGATRASRGTAARTSA